MEEAMTLMEFLEALSECNGDEAVAIVERFQSGGLTVEGVGVDDL